MAADERIAWNAILHVRPLPGKTGGLEGNPAGAYALVLALARDATEYRELVAAEMESLGLFIAELDDLTPYEPDDSDSESVQACASRLSAEWPVQYQDFHTYPRDET
jgi:hypothetical protein